MPQLPVIGPGAILDFRDQERFDEDGAFLPQGVVTTRWSRVFQAAA
ncbi:hypothetical protein [Sinorhizobium meliloti]|nr:hypothetical protein [Sinorhizobium meliloti]